MTRWGVFFSIWLALFVAFFLFRNEETKRIVPIQNNINLGTYHEELPDSFSFSEAKKVGGEVVFDYQLTTAKEEPFSGLFFYKADTHSQVFFKLDRFNRLSLDLTIQKAQRIPITITLNYPKFTDSVEVLGNLPLNFLLEVAPGRNDYSLDLRHFEIPSWFLRHHQLEKKDFPQLDLDRTNYIVVGTCQLLGGGIRDQIIVHEISAEHANTWLKVVLGTAALLNLLYFVLSYFMGKRKKVVVPVFATEAKIAADPGEAIKQYIAEHYSKTDLSPEDLQKALGVSTREIGVLIKKICNTNFKGYLNAVRIAEVKRLLKGSDLTVSEIAYQCGYGNVSHFNRVFKQLEGVSPKQYRNSHVS